MCVLVVDRVGVIPDVDGRVGGRLLEVKRHLPRGPVGAGREEGVVLVRGIGQARVRVRSVVRVDEQAIVGGATVRAVIELEVARGLVEADRRRLQVVVVLVDVIEGLRRVLRPVGLPRVRRVVIPGAPRGRGTEPCRVCDSLQRVVEIRPGARSDVFAGTRSGARRGRAVVVRVGEDVRVVTAQPRRCRRVLEPG